MLPHCPMGNSLTHILLLTYYISKSHEVLAKRIIFPWGTLVASSMKNIKFDVILRKFSVVCCKLSKIYTKFSVKITPNFGVDYWRCFTSNSTPKFILNY